VRVAQGWPHDVPLPTGYLPAPSVPAAHPAALAVVRAAAAAWAAAPASEVTVEQTADGRDATATLAATVTAAPARGDVNGDTDGTGTLWLDHGHHVLTWTRNGSGWTERAGTDPVDFGVAAPVSPFAVVALLADADAAAPARCPAGLPTAACFTAAVATADPRVPLSADTALAHRAGIPWLVLHAGVDDQGRPAFVRLAATAPAFGEPYSRLVSTATFTAYPESPPPPAAEPGRAEVVAPDQDAQQ